MYIYLGMAFSLFAFFAISLAFVIDFIRSYIVAAHPLPHNVNGQEQQTIDWLPLHLQRRICTYTQKYSTKYPVHGTIHSVPDHRVSLCLSGQLRRTKLQDFFELI